MQSFATTLLLAQLARAVSIDEPLNDIDNQAIYAQLAEEQCAPDTQDDPCAGFGEGQGFDDHDYTGTAYYVGHQAGHDVGISDCS